MIHGKSEKMVKEQMIQHYNIAKTHTVGMVHSEIGERFGVCGIMDEFIVVGILLYCIIATILVPLRMAGYSTWRILCCPCLVCKRCFKVCKKEVAKEVQKDEKNKKKKNKKHKKSGSQKKDPWEERTHNQDKELSVSESADTDAEQPVKSTKKTIKKQTKSRKHTNSH